ncbi:MAG: hypothetical protein AAF299_03880 [Pseudomonadota bacterium]
MSIPSLFPTRKPSEADAVTDGQKAHANRSGKSAGLARLVWRFRRKNKAGASFLNTGHLNDHVRRDIGLARSDLAKPE